MSGSTSGTRELRAKGSSGHMEGEGPALVVVCDSMGKFSSPGPVPLLTLLRKKDSLELN